jgi:ribonuclease P protein component
MVNQRFPKRMRLLRASDFERVLAARSSIADAWIVLHAAANDVGHPRLGLIVSRRVGGAVQRNRWKRLLREAFRLSQYRLPALDLVCLARAQRPPQLSQLMESLPTMAAQLERRIQQAAARRAEQAS